MPISTIREARVEVMTYFRDIWEAQTPPVPLLLYDDKERDVPDAAPFARITMRHNVRDRRTLGNETGNRRFRSFGIITVQIFTLAGDGVNDSDTYTDLVVKAFEGQKTGEDRVHFRNVSHIEVGQDGPWFQVNVTAEFDYDFIR